MAKTETDEKVMEMVEQELKKNPAVSVDELQEKAKSINQDVASLTARQFHARYPLQVKRRMATKGRAAKATRAPKKKAAPRRTRRARAKAPAAAPAPAAAGADRDAIRGTFLSFASALTAAEARKDLVKVLANVDKYIDQVVKAAGA
ncbi:MAG TPA: hypothetical protein VE173_15465 [Longimicrobiales bacterium]|nr:hypothetical protein [Longimicrobiales bacterium]